MRPSRTRRWPWLVAAALAFVLAAWLMQDAEPPPVTKRTVTLPTKKRPAEVKQAEARRTWLAPVVVDAGLAVGPLPKPRDPMLAVLPEDADVAMVVEINAIQHSPLGPQLFECLFGNREPLQDMLSRARDAGFDVGTDLDRVMVTRGPLVISGNFAHLDWSKLKSPTDRLGQYGLRAELFDANGGDIMGVWDRQLLVIGDAASVKAMLDRLDTPTVRRSALTEDDAYGEAYGVVSGDALASLEDDPKRAEFIKSAVKSVRVHANVDNDVGLVADVTGTSTAQTEDLRKTLAGALSAVRLKAKQEADQDKLDVLDVSRVGSAEKGTGFRLETGVPYVLMKRTLEQCISDNAKKQRARTASTEPRPAAPTP